MYNTATTCCSLMYAMGSFISAHIDLTSWRGRNAFLALSISNTLDRPVPGFCGIKYCKNVSESKLLPTLTHACKNTSSITCILCTTGSQFESLVSICGLYTLRLRIVPLLETEWRPGSDVMYVFCLIFFHWGLA